MQKPILAAAASAAALFAAPAAAAPESIAGTWKTEDGRSVIQFYQCGSSMCGKISRFLVPEPSGGVRDTENPDKAKRDRKLLGLRIFWQLRPDGSSWEGEGYSPEDGRYFNADISRNGDKLKVKGCVVVFCRSQTWTRI